MPSTILTFALVASFFVAAFWFDEIMKMLSIMGKALSELAAKIRFEILIYKANRNIKRKSK